MINSDKSFCGALYLDLVQYGVNLIYCIFLGELSAKNQVAKFTKMHKM